MEAQIIREYRKKKNMTQSELATKIGMKQNALSNYENGKSSIDRMSIREFMQLAKILEIPAEYIYLEKSPELDDRMEKLDKIRATEAEKDVLGRKKRITKYLMNLNDVPSSEGECLAVSRVNGGYQSKEMAFLLDVLPPVYNRYENDKRGIPYGIAVQVAYILDKRFEEIFD